VSNSVDCMAFQAKEKAERLLFLEMNIYIFDVAVVWTRCSCFSDSVILFFL
jgi:hypothetical protein